MTTWSSCYRGWYSTNDVNTNEYRSALEDSTFFVIKYLYSVTIDPYITYMYVYTTSTGTCKLVISHITQVHRYGTVHTVVVLVIFILVVVARACDVTSTARLVIES